MSKYIPIIGLEIHVELKTKSKMFCACANDPDEIKPNTNICEICLAHPGTLPVPNQKAIAYTVKIARALHCQIAKESKFDRKNYFYPDLPKGYQISQYDQPIGVNGQIELDFAESENHRLQANIGITRVHLEEDTARLSHEGENTKVDFNRSGLPLVEIVSEPDIQSAIEAKKYCQELQLIFRALGVSDADMEKGHMRCEANISLQEEGRYKKAKGAIEPIGDYVLNPKVELKNINSFRNIEKGIKYEIIRQTNMLEKGEKWTQETRGWDAVGQKTVWQRSKETSADYRYFPEPDIPPFNPLVMAGDEQTTSELPQQKRQRFHDEYGFTQADSHLLTANNHWADFTENVMSELYDWSSSLPETKNKDKNTVAGINTKNELARLAGGWLTSKLMGMMSEQKIDIKQLKIKPENFAELIALIYANRINSTNAQKILMEMLESGADKDPTHIMEEKGYGQVDDANKLGTIAAEIIKNYPEQVAQFKAGKEPIIKFLIGMAMKATEGSADPKVMEKILRQKMG
ncbi:MAG: Asp-tRNA(Asn)/Glu-tRNA(Gln) amidotransferase subunit GatB [Candidatus Magasanikbacteria bacterium CG10_big_fil_rev_8_21_14_0_10_40_10]|uniref:Aspartyl/glutamyl-tRNA(Asn/Gln) amidotransferase subunit B n=1 Tax=Candidatus Magasanikbacteria bacterium CG10_big_fil_rev_8_21_14_0_10_40_10 TaxID=1974648 RepID=A0A2M6W3X4_9BACT|nr:MAG: Asp-tRNA(Asn)/Glu-tRNA(Gln) amidotransferase subunit GatB [Candidatus Magasanikbacteria bacterium CG10_big_fil_rev_8_21_14_0_10_40_10]